MSKQIAKYRRFSIKIMASNADIFGRLRFSPDENSPERPNPATSRVKRCLFGRGDPEENIRFAKKELEKSLADSKKRWNFDFESERPLDGRYEWHSPYPKYRPASGAASVASKENSNPSNPCSKPTSDSSSDSTSSSPDPDSKATEVASAASIASTASTLPGATRAASASSSSSTSSDPSGPSSQRTTRQSSINQIFRQRKRSKSKVKVQERRKSSETEDFNPRTLESEQSENKIKQSD